MSNIQNVLGQINTVAVEISTWSGGASLKKEDIGVDIPDRAFSLGRKYLIAPERLAPFPTIRRRARERCLKVGTRFLGGFALPADQAIMDDLVADLEAMRREFEDKKAELMRDFHSSIDEWVSEEAVRPYEHLIRAAIPPLASIDKRMQFRYSIYQVGVPAVAPERYLEQATQELGANLFAEVADAAETMARSFRERNVNNGIAKLDWAFSSRTVDAVCVLRDKLKGLEFVDSRIPPVVDEIDRVVNMLPRAGKLEGIAARQLYSLLIVLSSDQRMLEFGQGLLALGSVINQEFGGLLSMQGNLLTTVPEAEPEAVPSAPATDDAPADDGWLNEAELETVPSAPAASDAPADDGWLNEAEPEAVPSAPATSNAPADDGWLNEVEPEAVPSAPATDDAPADDGWLNEAELETVPSAPAADDAPADDDRLNEVELDDDADEHPLVLAPQMPVLDIQGFAINF